MSDPAVTLLADAFGRVRELVEQLGPDVDGTTATFQADPGANTPAWLLWHLVRVQDDHLSDLAGVDQAWSTWADRLDLPFDHCDIGYGQDVEQVRAVTTPGSVLVDYHADVHTLTLRYLDSVTTEELARVVDDRWDPPVTASARLVSVLGDTLQHLGQLAYVLGVASRRD